MSLWALTWLVGALKDQHYAIAVLYLLLFLLLGSFTVYVTYVRMKRFREGTYMRKGTSIWP